MPTKKTRKPAASIEEIARLANVSTTTVSMVLNGKAEQYRISQKTRDNVQALARKLHYTPNASARSLRLKKTQVIGLVITDLSNYFFTQLAKQLEQICRANGYLLQISASEDNETLEETIIQNFIAKSVDGLIIASVHRDDKFLSSLISDTPTVFIDRQLKGGHFSCVASDNYGGTYQLVRHLAECSPREIAYIGGIKHVSSNVERLRGYKDALTHCHIPLNESMIIEGGYSIESGHHSMKALLDSMGRLPDALFTASFTLLEGVLSALMAFSHSPSSPITLNEIQKIKFGTYDDHPLLDYTEPTIHSVRQNYAEIAHKAFECLSCHIKGDKTVACEIVSASLCLR